MENLARDHARRERLESVRLEQASLNRLKTADNYVQPKATPTRSTPSFAREKVQRADNYYAKQRNQTNWQNLHLRQAAEKENVEQKHAERLMQARNDNAIAAKEKFASTKNSAGEITTKKNEAAELLSEINLLGDLPFVAAFGAAILKDILDSIFNVVLIGALFSLLCSIFIFFMILLAGAGKKRKTAKGFVKKRSMLVFGGIVDAIPGIGFLPIETLTVGIIYALTLVERRNVKY